MYVKYISRGVVIVVVRLCAECSVMSRCVVVCMCVCVCRYNIEQEQKLATETTFLVESYTVSWGY